MNPPSTKSMFSTYNVTVSIKCGDVFSSLCNRSLFNNQCLSLRLGICTRIAIREIPCGAKS